MAQHTPGSNNVMLRTARRTAVAVAGGLVIVAGLAMLALPGPGGLVVFLGFAILGTEFVWAKRVERRARVEAKAVADDVRSRTRRLQQARERAQARKQRRGTGRVDAPGGSSKAPTG